MRIMKITCCLLIFWLSTGVLAQETAYDFVPDATYEEVADRISCMESEVPLHYNEKVKGFIDYFTIRDRAYTRDVMNRVDMYFPLFEETLRKYNLPEDLKYLAIVESGLRANAVSRAGAVGLWQFMPSTGKLYGLKNDWYVDDRMDPVKATDAACRHLRDLHNMFKDWELALAAYNCGPGNVRKAIKRSGYKRTFWEIYPYLPRETRSYVPQFVAIAYTLHYAAEHNLMAEKPVFLPQFDTIQVSQYFHLETFGKHVNICLDDLLALNPSIKRGALPEGTRDFALRVPASKKDWIASNRTMLYDTAGKVGKAELDYLARNMPGSTYGREKLVYQVRSGDVLGAIAQRHHVRVEDIRTWNKLSSNTIYVGQRLSIWVLPTYTSATRGLYTPTGAASQETAALLEGQKIYKVQPGDTLWSIANQYPNLSVEKIKQLNKLTTNTIQPGQELILAAE